MINNGSGENHSGLQENPHKTAAERTVASKPLPGFERWIRRCISSIFFLGYIPFMPGTVGSACAVVVLWYVKTSFPFLFSNSDIHSGFWLLSLAFIAGSIVFSSRSEELFHKSDSPHIIIDEFAGQWITFFMIPLTWRTMVLGFFLFRAFDILKPFPVHVFEELDDGVGVTMDDVAAGVMANIALVVVLATYSLVRQYLYS